MVALKGIQNILWRNWNLHKCTTIILLVTAKNCFISTEFIPKDNHLLIDSITVLKDQPQASVDVAKRFLEIVGFFGVFFVQRIKKEASCWYIYSFCTSGMKCFFWFWNSFWIFFPAGMSRSIDLIVLNRIFFYVIFFSGGGNSLKIWSCSRKFWNFWNHKRDYFGFCQF